MSKDTRLAEEINPHTREDRRNSHTSRDTGRDAVAVTPDFTCEGCGRPYWQAREPVHCVKCGGMLFTRPPQPAPEDLIPAACLTIRRHAEAIIGRAAGKGKLATLAREVERIAEEMLVEIGGGNGCTRKGLGNGGEIGASKGT